ncbi:MAG: fused MFS/spermidine synthase, partial [Alphaproteobacteria bacterium]|nr:fused MFS/spermidine synthase [Alphaproteobacteria bacterium]
MSILTARNWRDLSSVGLVDDRHSLLVFAATLLLSASLLFSVQPLFAKMVLPYLGGSPSVWAVAMCFFQAALLAGYCYAHALNRFVPSQWAPVVHLALCATAFLALPFGLPEWAHDVPDGNTYWWLVAVLAAGVGLPFFAVSANAPLLQAWFARSGHPHASDPYFLYGASNLGSLASLLAYPFVIEPMLGLDTQTSVWTWGFGILTAMLIVCGVLMIAGKRNRGTASAGADAGSPAAAPLRAVTNTARLSWIGFAFVPSALLVAFTTHITTDIASAPFLWVIPLATFLGTFVIVFRTKSLIPHDMVLRLHPYLVAAALLFAVIPNAGSVAVQGIVGFATFIATTLVCHRALYDARPNAERLTEFYLLMSFGGVLGGIFAALLAPQLFNTVAEYPLLIIAGLFARPNVCAKVMDADHRKSVAMVGGYALAGVAALALADTAGLVTSAQAKGTIGVVILALILSIVVFAARPVVIAKLGLSAATAFLLVSSISLDGYTERSFFGVSRVMDSSDGQFRLLIHGSTLHGGEKLVDSSGNRPSTPPPVLYYYPGAPMARGFAVARNVLPNNGDPLRVGVIGLGTGSLACHLKSRESITFYEIDPVVIDIARNPEHFRYLSKCAPQSGMVLGDARLKLAKAQGAEYDYFVVDAFSSDAVPVHLLTREAIKLYLSKIASQGVIALHISNKHLELESVVAATTQTLDGVHVAAVLEPNGLPGYDGNPSHVVFLSKSKTTIDQLLAWKDARPA